MALDTGSRLIIGQDNEIQYVLVKWLRNAVKKEKRGEKTLRGVKKGHVDKVKVLEPKESYIAGGH